MLDIIDSGYQAKHEEITNAKHFQSSS